MTNYISSFRINDSHPEDFNLFEHPESKWDETEIDKIESKLSDPGLTAEHRIKFIESYLKDEQLIKHNIRGTLLDYAARHFRYNIFKEKKPRLNEVSFIELTEKEQKEYNDSYNNFYKSIETEIDKIGILEYYKNNRDEFYPDKYTLKGNIKILECLFKHWNILNITATKETPRKKEPENLWSITDEKKHKIYTALNKEKILKYSGEGKPFTTIENGLYIFKVFHELEYIDKNLISITTEAKKEKWSYSFICNEFIRDKKRKDEKEFDSTNLAQKKEALFEKKASDREYIERIKSIIQSALTA